jgi:hypothetical protein
MQHKITVLKSLHKNHDMNSNPSCLLMASTYEVHNNGDLST